jgi:hypothetical protein
MRAHLDETGLTDNATARLPAAIRQVVERMEAEFREMPGMRLTASQAQRLWGLDRATCRVALDTLAGRGFLTRASNGTYLHKR